MPIDPQLQQMLEAMRDAGLPKIGSLPAAQLREVMSASAPPTIEVKSIRDIEIPTGAGPIRARLYQPSDTAKGLIVYYHGGGWVIGDLNTADCMLRILATETNCALLSVDYRLAPETPFPAAVDDAFAALNWAAAERATLAGKADVPLAVMGDSAGGNLAAVVAQLVRGAGMLKIDLQVLVYPATEGELDSEAMGAFEPPFLTLDEITWFYDQYIPASRRDDPRFAPGKAPDLSNLPPAVIVTAEHDLLAAEGRLYAEKLRAAGGRATLLAYDGAIHGFFTAVPMFEIAQRAIREVAVIIGREFTQGKAIA
jgi:acetyl esterase